MKQLLGEPWGSTCSRRKSCGLKSLGEQPHQSTMCLYWHLQPSLRFQLVTRRLLSTRLSQARLFSSTVWKKDYRWQGRVEGELWIPNRAPSQASGRAWVTHLSWEQRVCVELA